MPDPGEEKKISELDVATTLEDTDEIVIARPGVPYANYSVSGAIVKNSAKQACMGGQVSIAEGDTTPSVAGTHFLRYSSTNNITITNLDDGVYGQDIYIGVQSTGTLTLSNSFVYAPSGESPVLDNHDVAHLLNMNGVWHVVSVSHNS